LRLAVLLLVAIGCLPAQYFPLAVGNQWIYRLEEGPVKDVRQAAITGVEAVGGQEWYRYSGLFGETALIRMTSDNRLVARREDGGEALWADFAVAEGGVYAVNVEECTAGRARVESRREEAELVRFRWQGGFRVAYAGSQCADAGITSDLYLPGLGLAERVFNSISGPRRYRAVYARIGNATVLAGPELAFRLSLDQAEYRQEAVIRLRITLDNGTGKPLMLAFPSAQTYDFSIRNAAGESVYTWSADKRFAALYREVPFEGETNWTEQHSLRLRPGEYTLAAWLTTDGGTPYRAQAPFTVR
jgi:hypothetical protein